MKPRSKPQQQKIRIFYAPRFFSGQNRKKKVRKLREQIRYITQKIKIKPFFGNTTPLLSHKGATLWRNMNAFIQPIVIK